MPPDSSQAAIRIGSFPIFTDIPVASSMTTSLPGLSLIWASALYMTFASLANPTAVLTTLTLTLVRPSAWARCSAFLAHSDTAGISYLLPFLPPQDHRTVVNPGSDVAPSPETRQTATVTPDSLPAELRTLLLSLSSAGIPCQTIGRGDDLVRRLSLWRPGVRSSAKAI